MTLEFTAVSPLLQPDSVCYKHGLSHQKNQNQQDVLWKKSLVLWKKSLVENRQKILHEISDFRFKSMGFVLTPADSNFAVIF